MTMIVSGKEGLATIRSFASNLFQKSCTKGLITFQRLQDHGLTNKCVQWKRQYMPNKPHKWRVKLMVHCDTYGYLYKFELYNGAGDNKILPGVPDSGVTLNIVVRWSESVPNFKNHIIYLDNLYTSAPLFVYLRFRGIYSLGTIRESLIVNYQLAMIRSWRNKNVDMQLNIVIERMVSKYLLYYEKIRKMLPCHQRMVIPKHSNEKLTHSHVKQRDMIEKTKKYIKMNCPQFIREYKNSPSCSSY